MRCRADAREGARPSVWGRGKGKAGVVRKGKVVTQCSGVSELSHLMSQW